MPHRHRAEGCCHPRVVGQQGGGRPPRGLSEAGQAQGKAERGLGVGPLSPGFRGPRSIELAATPRAYRSTEEHADERVVPWRNGRVRRQAEQRKPMRCIPEPPGTANASCQEIERLTKTHGIHTVRAYALRSSATSRIGRCPSCLSDPPPEPRIQCPGAPQRDPPGQGNQDRPDSAQQKPLRDRPAGRLIPVQPPPARCRPAARPAAQRAGSRPARTPRWEPDTAHPGPRSADRWPSGAGAPPAPQSNAPKAPASCVPPSPRRCGAGVHRSGRWRIQVDDAVIPPAGRRTEPPAAPPDVRGTPRPAGGSGISGRPATGRARPWRPAGGHPPNPGQWRRRGEDVAWDVASLCRSRRGRTACARVGAGRQLAGRREQGTGAPGAAVARPRNAAPVGATRGTTAATALCLCGTPPPPGEKSLPTGESPT